MATHDLAAAATAKDGGMHEQRKVGPILTTTSTPIRLRCRTQRRTSSPRRASSRFALLALLARSGAFAARCRSADADADVRATPCVLPQAVGEQQDGAAGPADVPGDDELAGMSKTQRKKLMKRQL